MASFREREGLRHRNNSVASSTGSRHGTVTGDTFSDIENDSEVFNSSRLNAAAYRFTTSGYIPPPPMLPVPAGSKLRDSAEKYRPNSWSPRRYMVNTSEIGNHFPDFSSGGSDRGSDHEFSLSMEAPRGPDQ
jgi:hypothetical protein